MIELKIVKEIKDKTSVVLKFVHLQMALMLVVNTILS